MKKFLFLLIAVSLAALFLIRNFDASGVIASRQQSNDALIAEKMALHLGVQAYLYGYPIVDMPKQMHNETHKVAQGQQEYAPVNRLYRFPELVTPTTSGNFRAPNNDTLYYTGWFDISKEPLIIHVPNTKGRYYTIAVTNQFSEVIHLGRRTTGTAQKFFALTGPAWEGELPANVQQVPVDSNKGWLLGRMLVDGPEDFDAAMTLVNKVWLAGLSEFNGLERPAKPAQKSANAIDPITSLEFFRILNQELKTLPARPGEASLMANLDEIGIGPNSEFDIDKLSDARRAGLLKAIEEGQAIVNAATQRTIPSHNGWMISKDIGRYGYQFMHRASVVRGGYGNLPEESLYPATLFDANGDLLNGGNHYRLHFAKGQLPPVNGFWSLSVYTLPRMTLEENSIARYSIGDRTRDLHYAEDGSLTLLLQHEKPTTNTNNWLPTPAGNFAAIMRLYEPAATALDNSYLLPKIEEVQ